MVSVKINIEFPDGPKTLEMVQKEPFEFDECLDGKVVCINLLNGNTYTGKFAGIIDEEEILIQSLSSQHVIGLRQCWIKDYWEEV